MLKPLNLKKKQSWINRLVYTSEECIEITCVSKVQERGNKFSYIQFGKEVKYTIE